MQRDAGDPDSPGRVLCYGEDIGPGAVEEVGCEEAAPGSPRPESAGTATGPPRRGIDPGIRQDLPHCRRGGRHPGRSARRGFCGNPIQGSPWPAGRPRPLTFRRVAGRPVLPCLDRAAQRRRMMSRCQRRTVSGVTRRRSPWRRALGTRLRRAAIRARSAQFRLGRRGWRRCRTASLWRRIRISAFFHVS